MFCTCVRSFYGFNTLIFIILNCNSIHYALQLDADDTVICVRKRDEMVQIRRWFDANCSIFLCEISLQFVLKCVIVWLSMLCNSLEYGTHLEWGRLSFWILQSIQGNCKVCWKELTYILLLRMWVQQQPLYLLKYSLIFLDVACDEAAKTASRKAPNRFAIYLRISENIWKYQFICPPTTLISSKIFLDILRCRLRWGGQNCK